MLSLSGQVSPFCGAGWQLARELAPFVATVVTRRGVSSSSAACAASPAPAAALVQPTLANLPLDAAQLPRFNPEAAYGNDGVVLAPHHTSQRFSPVLSLYRSQYPDAVWTKIAGLFPKRSVQPPLAIDVAVGSEGRAGVELAKRGFRVLSVGGDAMVLNRTYMCAAANNARINLITAEMEKTLVPNEAADLVTCMHGLHLLNTRQAVAEIHRIMKVRGKLVVGWNDRDLKNGFITELEDLIEHHVPSYSRTERQHETQAWAPCLQACGLFRVLEVNTHFNGVVLRNAATLCDILNSQGYVRENLRGAARKRFNSEVWDLVEQRFGEGPLLLPMQTRLFVLEKTDHATM